MTRDASFAGQTGTNLALKPSHTSNGTYAVGSRMPRLDHEPVSLVVVSIQPSSPIAAIRNITRTFLHLLRAARSSLPLGFQWKKMRRHLRGH